MKAHQQKLKSKLSFHNNCHRKMSTKEKNKSSENKLEGDENQTEQENQTDQEDQTEHENQTDQDFEDKINDFETVQKMENINQRKTNESTFDEWLELFFPRKTHQIILTDEDLISTQESEKRVIRFQWLEVRLKIPKLASLEWKE